MSVWEDVKYSLFRKQNALNHLLLINIVAFGLASLFKLMLFFFNMSEVAESAVRYLYVPGNPGLFLLRLWTPFTYQFMHTSVFHIFFNMLMFYFMGSVIQDFLGSRKLLLIYLAGGVTAAMFFLISYNIFPVFSRSANLGFLVGASGSVMAVTAAAATLIPHYEVMLFGAIRIKLKWLALGLILMDITGIPEGNPGGGIAHLGGAFFGLLYILYIRGDISNPFRGITDTVQKIWSKKPVVDEKKIYREKVYSHSETRSSGGRKESRSGKPAQAEIDAILDKISQSGYDSLTATEKEILFRASE